MAQHISHWQAVAHMISENQSAQTQTNEQCIMQSNTKSNQRVINITEQLPEYQSEWNWVKQIQSADRTVSSFEDSVCLSQCADLKEKKGKKPVNVRVSIWVFWEKKEGENYNDELNVEF